MISCKDLIATIRDTSLTTKERGDALEDYIVEYINTETGFTAKKTKMSGALHGDGDINTDDIMQLDGKVHGKCTSVSIPRTELEKIQMQAAKLDRVGAIVTPVIKDDENADLYVTIKLSDLQTLVAYHCAMVVTDMDVV